MIQRDVAVLELPSNFHIQNISKVHKWIRVFDSIFQAYCHKVKKN
jgi:hypothetical protein